MDEIWQRHKVFILQVAIGTIVLLIAWGVHSSMYEGITTQAQSNAISKTELQGMIAKGEAPSRDAIAEQQRIAAEGDRQITAMAAKVASIAATGNDDLEYVRENVTWICSNIGRNDQIDRYVGLYGQLKQTCLFELREEARSVLVARAAQLGRSVDETLGIQSAFPDEDVAVAIHGLAVSVELVKRALDLSVAAKTANDNVEGVIDEISEIRVNVRSRGSRMTEGVAEQVAFFPVKLTVRGDPDAVLALLRSFNTTSNQVSRMMILEKFDGGERERADSDRVRMTFNLWGLRHIGVAD